MSRSPTRSHGPQGVERVAVIPQGIAAHPLRKLSVALASAMAIGVPHAVLAASTVTARAGLPTGMTQVAANGATIDVTTVRANGSTTTAFNSFRDFNVGQGDTVNLHLPTGANNLVNLVDSQAIVNGTVNGMVGTTSGAGRVFFADANGMVVGATGAINVGALSIATPSQASMDALSGEALLGGGAFTSKLLDGSIDHDAASVVVDGHITATSGVRIQAHAIDASGTVFVTGGATGTGLDTAVNTGSDGTVTVVKDDQGIRLVAEDIAIKQGAQVKAVDSHGTGVADVTLAASGEATVTSGQASANSSVTVNGTLAGKNVSIGATSAATADYQNADDAIATLGSVATDAAAKLGVSNLPIGVVAAASNAAVTLGANAIIVADGDVVVQAATAAKAATSALNDKAGQSLLAAGVYGETTGTTTATVQSGASIAAGGNVSVKALHSSDLDITAKVSGKNTVAVAAAIGNVSAETDASIAQGATITGNGIAVLAHNSGSYGVTSTVEANSTSPVGANAALLFVDTNANATNSANLGTTAKPVGSLTVLADSVTSKTEVGAETSVGGADKDAAPKPVVASAGDGMMPFLQGKLGDNLSKADDTTAKQENQPAQPKGDDAAGKSALRGGVGISLATVDQGAHASIGNGAVVKASGDLVVQANLVSAGTKIAATTETESGEDNAAKVSASLAIGVSLLHNDASATIGANADLTALHIGVGSNVSVPWDLPSTSGLNEFSNIPEFLKDIYTDLSKNGGPLAASYVNAKSQSADVGLAGAISFFALANDNTAWVGSGAKLNATAATDAAWTGSVALGNDAEGAAIAPVALSFNHAIGVTANTTVQTIDISGNIDLLKVNGTGGTSTDADAVGGGVNLTNYADNTIAGIGDGVTATAKGVSVDANDTQQMVVITPSAGRGSGVSGNVIFATANIDNTTHASITNTARIVADVVDVTAHQGAGIWSIAGAIAQGTSVGVGVGIAINHLDGDTRAYIGNNAADATQVDPAMAAATAMPTAGIAAGAVNVLASTDGRSGAIAISGAQAKGEDKKPTDGSGGSGGTGTGGTGTGTTSGSTPSAEGISNDLSPDFLKTTQASSDSSTSGFGIDTILAKLPVIGDMLGTAKKEEGSSDTGTPPPASKPKVAVGVAGSATVDIGNLDTRASIDGIAIDRGTGATASDIGVTALNQTDLISASGAAALASAKTESKASTGLAGAVAYSVMDNDTTATLSNVTAPHAGDVTVRAFSGGSILDLGLGLAKNANSDQEASAAAGSFSIGTTNNDTSAGIAASTLTAADATSSLGVTAYDHTDIGAGGGAFAIGGSKGFGVAVTWSDITNTNAASISCGTYSGFGGLSVQALTASRIAAAAIGTAYSNTTDSQELSGSFTFNQVSNSVSARVTNATIASGQGDVTVQASGSAPVQAYDDLLASHGRSVANVIDFSGSAIGGVAPTGAAIFAVSGAIAVGGESAGMAAAVNTIADSYAAVLSGGSVTTTGNVAVTATDATRIVALAAGIGGSKGQFAGAGSMTANFINDNVTATLGDSSKLTGTTVSGATVAVQATNAALIDTLAGAVAVSTKGASAGLAVAFDEIGSQTSASIVDAGITTNGSATAAGCAGAAAAVSATACATGTINAAAVGVAGADKVALTGSLAINDIGLEDTGAIGSLASALRPTFTRASIDASRLDTSSIGVHANDSATIDTLAGAIAGSSEAAAGAGFALENIGANTSAGFTASQVKASGAVNVGAASTGSIDAIAVGGALSGDVAVGGSVTANLIGNHTTATVDGLSGYGGATRASMTSLDVSATDSASIDSLAGALAIGLEAGGVGAASSVNGIANLTHATLSNSVLDVRDSTTVEAASTAAIRSLAAAAAGGEGLGLAGALTVNTIGNDIAATISGGSQDSAGNTTRVTASDDASILSMAGSLGVSAGGGLGAAIAVNDIRTTTAAELDGATWHAKNVTVAADSSNPGTGANIRTVAAGVGGGSVGGAASAATNLSSAKVSAAITGGAQVTAENNIAVTAVNRQGIDVFAGSAGIGVGAVGVGLGAVVNYLHDTTTAYIDGTGTHVNALGKDASDTVSVASGQLAHPEKLDTGTIHGSGDYVSPDLSEGNVAISGLAVNASSTQAVATLGASVAAAFDPVGSAAIAVMGNANVLGGTTSAYIADASVNQDNANTGAGAAQAVDVRASSHAYDASFVAGVAGGANVAGSGALGANAFQRSTQASIQDATVTTNGLANVDAESSQRSVAAVVGLAAGLAGGAGTGVVNVFDAGTSAAVTHGTLSAGSLDVTAHSLSQANMIGGAGAFGGVAVAGAFLLSDSHNTTSASIGDTAGDTTLHVGGDVDVDARSDVTLGSAMVSGAGAGGTAVAGMASVTVVGNTTTATLERTQLDRDASDTAASSLEVHAAETIGVTPDAASAAVSFGSAGVGAAANVVIVQGAVGASILDSAASVAGHTDVAATSTKTLDITTLSGGLGAGVGLSGALGLAIIGNGSLTDSASGSNPLGELDKGGNGTLSAMNGMGGQGLASGAQMGGHLSQSDADAVNAATKVGLLDGNHQLLRQRDGTQATIGNSTLVTGSLDVTATGTTSLTNVVGNVAAGAFLGAGGAIAFSLVDQNVGATVDAQSTVTSGGAMNVTAQSLNGTAHAYGANLQAESGTYSVATSAYQGAAGFVGLGGAIAISELSNHVSAIGAGTIRLGNGSALAITAQDQTAVAARGGGAVAGGLAGGVVVSQADKHGDTTASIGDNASVSGAGAVGVNAGSTGAVSAKATAVAAGLFVAANGADANARDRESITAIVGKEAHVTAYALAVQAVSTPQVDAQAFGVAVSGGVSLGASVATAEGDQQVLAKVDDSAYLTATGDSRILATNGTTAGNGVRATAVGGAGGLLLGANASAATAASNASVQALTGDSVRLPNANLTLQAINTTMQTASATAGAAGFIGVGAAVAEADATTVTAASLGTNTLSGGTRTGTLHLDAEGSDTNLADATAGSGGVISGNAAVARTSNTGSTSATVGDGSSIHGGAMAITASHQADYAVAVNAAGAGIANMSGGFASTNVTSNVSAGLGNGAALYGSGFIDIGSSNHFMNVGTAPQVQGGGGGVLSGAAATNSTSLGGTASARVGDSSTIVSGLDAGMANALANQYDGYVYTSGADPFANPGRILIGADTQIVDNATVSLDSGGAVAGSGVRNSLTATVTNDVGTGSNDKLLTNGAIGLGSDVQSMTSQSALTHTYGGGALGAASASTSITATQNVTVGDNSMLLAFSQINLTAGIDPAGFAPTVFSADSVGQAYVRGIIAIATGSATTTVHSTANTTIGTGARVLGGADINLGSYRGTANVTAEGAGHGYELGFIPVTTTDSNASADGSENLALRGSVTAGIYADNEVNIDAGMQLTHAHGAPLLYNRDDNFSPWSYIDQHAAGLGANTDSSGNKGVPVVTGAGQLQAPTGLTPVNNNGDSDVAPAASSGTTGVSPGSASADDLSVAEILKGTTTPGTTSAFTLGSMFASGGNLTVHAGNISGSGVLAANGSPSVAVNNASSAYLVLNDINVSANAGGAVTFTGGANAASDAAMGVHNDTSGIAPSVTLNNSYTGSMPNQPSSVTQGPAMLLGGTITNLGGLVDISNATGSVGQFAPISAQQIKEYVPNGAVAVYLPNGAYHSGSDPVASYLPYQIDLGNATNAVMYAVNAIYNANGQYTSNDDLSNRLYNTLGTGNLAFNNGKEGGVSMIFLGTCLPYANSTCGTNPGTAGTYDFHGQALPKLWVLPTTKTIAADPTPTNASASGLIAQTIAVKAKFIDIDSAMTAGRPTDYTITLSAAAKTFIDGQSGSSGQVDLPTNLWCASGGATCTPGLVKYDLGTKTIVIANVNASGGGFVSLDGGIISTKALGNITINDGYGHVTLNNALGLPVQLADINTGNNAVGELKITDTFKQYTDANGSWSQTQWYVDTRGAGTKVYTNSNRATDLAGAVAVAPSSDASGLYYDPEAGLRYQWQQQVNLKRSIPTLQSVSNWGYVDASGVAVATPQYLLVSSGVIEHSSISANFTESIAATATYGAVGNSNTASVVDVYYHGCGGSNGSGCHYGFSRTTDAAGDIHNDSHGAGVWQYVLPTDAQLLLTSSVKADNRIRINFQGNASGQVLVNSNANVLLSGNIYNPSGNTTIDATQGAGGAIVAGVHGAITSNGVTLKATGGIGDAVNPLQLVMTGGTLAADAGAQGVNIKASTALQLDHVNAGNASGWGDVTLNAVGSVTGGTGTTISGRDITVNAGGAVGNTGQSLNIAAHGVTNASHGIDHGVVDVHALNDINLRQQGGDLRVGLIQSDGGSVNIDVPDGAIVDAAGVTSGQALSQAQLVQVRDTLHLTTDDDANGAIAAANRKRIEQTADGNYTQYQGLMANGSVVGGNFVLDMGKIALYRGLASAELGHAASDAETLTYAAARYATLDGYFTGLLGNGYASSSAFVTPVADLAYHATDAQLAAITQDAYWKLGWLTSSVNSAALVDAGSTTPPPLSFVGSAAPNIQGRDVTLSARGNIGSPGDAVSITGQSLIDGTVTDAQAAALATANAAGDISVVKDANGNIVRLDVKQTQPLFLTAGGTVSATTQAGQGGSVYLQANGDLTIGTINADRDVRLAAVGNIRAAGADNGQAQVLANGDLTMLTGSGSSIGQALDVANQIPQRALVYSIGGLLVDATASQDIVLRSKDHDLRFDRIRTNGLVSLDAGSGSIVQQLAGLALSGRAITLNAGGDVGYYDGTGYLQVATGTGTLDGTVGGKVRIASPGAGALNIGHLTAGGTVDLVSTGDLTVTSIGGSAVNLSSGNDATLGTVTGTGDVALTAVRDLTLGTVKGATLAVQAGRNITATDLGSGVANATVLTGATLQLHAGGSIGSPLRVSAVAVQARADQGALMLDMVSGLQDGTFNAGGAFTLSGNSLHGSSIQAGGDITVAATGDVVFGSVSGANTSMQAGTSLGVTTLAANGAARLQAGADASVGTLTATGDASLTGGTTLGVTSLTVGHDLTVGAGGKTTLGTTGVGNDATLTLSDALDSGTLTVGHDLTAAVTGAVTLDTTSVANDATLTLGSDFASTQLGVGHDLTATVTGNVLSKQLDVGNDIAATIGGNASFDSSAIHHDASVDVAGTLDSGKLDVTRNLTAKVGGKTTLAATTVGGDASLSLSDALDSGSFSVGHDLMAAATGAVALGTTAVSNDATLTLGSDFASTQLSVGHDLAATITGNVASKQLDVGNDLGATIKGNASFDTSAIHHDASVDVAGTLDSGKLDVTRNLTAKVGGKTTLAATTVGGDASLSLSDALDSGSFSVGHDLMAAATGAVALGTTAVANDATLTLGSDFASTQLSVGHDLAATITGNVASKQLDVGNDLGATVKGHASFDTSTIHHAASVDVAGTLDSGKLDVTDDLTAKVGGKTTLATTTVGNDASLTLSDALNSGGLTVGHDLMAAVTGAVALDTTSVANDATLVLGGDFASTQLGVGHDLMASITGDVQSTQLDIGNDLGATVKGHASFDTSTIHHAASVDVAGTLDSGKLDVTDNLTAKVGGKMTLATTTVGGDASLTLADALDSGSLTVGHDLIAAVTGAVTLGTTAVANDATLTLGGDFTSMQLGVGHDLTAAVSGNVASKQLDVGNDLGAVVKGNASFDTSAIHNDATADIAGTLNSGHLDVTGNLAAKVGGKTTLATTTVGGDASLTLADVLNSGSLSVGHDLAAAVTGAAVLGTTSVANDATLTVGSDLTSAQMSVNHDLTASVGGTTSSTRLDVGHDLSAMLTGNATFGTTTVGRDGLFEAADQLALGMLSTGRDTVATSNNDLSFAGIDAGRDIMLRSLHGQVLGGTAHAAGRLQGTAAGSLVADALTAGQDVTLASGNDVKVGTMAAGTVVGIDAAHDIALGNATAQTGTRLAAGNDMALGTLNVLQGNLQGTAGRDLALSAYDVSGDVSLVAGRDMRLGNGRNGGNLTLGLGRNLDFASLSSRGPIAIDSSTGTIHGADLVTDTATLGAHEAIVLDSSHIGSRLNLAASDIDVHTLQTAAGKPMTMTLTGYHGNVAKKIVIDLRNADSWMIQRLATVQAVLDTSATKVTIADGVVQGDMLLVTPQARVYMNNVTPKLVMADIQYFEPDTRFTFALDAKAAMSDAYVSRYTVGYDVTMPNYIENHQSGDLDYYGGSVLRYLGSTLTLHTNDEPAHDDVPMPVRQDDQRKRDDDDLIAPDAAGAVNLGSVN
ncbi:leukotoxin LktA family filamentous adhesin [Luteibacter sp. 9135]|uniref:leukotoxin LktA family filamentous adhesin n=1 Tax=Luteibacter sp. 9135 TaxID=1500893 RepID=UPI00055DF925|nr:leukotoxin LktA family filamentous adhesin [Luteibacter sp. 9135]